MKAQLRKMKSRTCQFFGQLLIAPSGPNEVPRSHRHLEDQYRRTLLSPMVASDQIIRLLKKDEAFLEMIDFDRHPDYLVLACLVGEELRANVYELARFDCGLMAPAHNSNWAKEGVARYVIRHNFGEPNIEALTKDTAFDETLTFDPFEPVRSYYRDLDRDEVAQINVFSKTNWSKLQ